MKTGLFTLCALGFVLTTLAPAAKPADQETAQEAPSALTISRNAAPAEAAPGGLRIILLEPSVRFEDLRGSTQEVKAAETDYQHVLIDAATRGVGSRTTLLTEDKLEAPAREVCAKLGPLASRLARGNVNEDATQDLAQLAAMDEQYAVLVQFFRLETGPGRSWNSFTGAITSSTASTLIQMALISGKTGKVLWKGERLIRNKALRSTDNDLAKALTLLYKDFDINQ